MDTAAYLTKQGWRGDGHALHHSGRGITKPIRVSQKQNVLGIGKKKHDAHADQWWARAFDATLKGINASENVDTGKVESISLGAGAQALQMVGNGGAKWVGQGGLYSNFVKGESLGGTLTPEEENNSASDCQNTLSVTGVESEKAAQKKRRKASKEPRQRDEVTLIINTISGKLPAHSVGEAAKRSKYSKVDRVETKQERRQRKKDGKARKAMKDG